MNKQSAAPARPGFAPKLCPPVLLAIYAHARREFPRECCGYITQDAAGHWQAHPCHNAQDHLHALDPQAFPRDSHFAYAIDGAELLKLARSLDSDRPARILYHSHPRGGAYFSSQDAKAALASGYTLDHLVIDVRDDGVRESRCFRLSAPTSAPTQDFIEIARFPGEAELSSQAEDPSLDTLNS